MNISEVYFELLRSALSGTNISIETEKFISNETLPKLYSLSKKHDTAHIIATVLNEKGLLKDGSKAKTVFLKELNLAVLRVEQIDYEIGVLSDVLEQSETRFIILKGAVIRPYYPQRWMRTSCDVDLLVAEKDIDKVVGVLTEKLEYVVQDRDAHEVTLVSPSGVNLELHFRLLESRFPKAVKILNNIWEYTKIKEGKQYQTELTPEMFYFYHVTHMAKHFVYGGCGVRPLMDTWVLTHFAGFDLRCADKLLKQADLLTFAEKVEQLSEVWFSNKEKTPLFESLERFILQGGAYGTVQNGVAVRQVRQGGKFKYFMSRIFVSYEVLSGQYPVLKKHKWLTPLYQVIRWFRMIFSGRMNRTVKEVKASGNLTKEQVRETANLLEQIGL